MSFPLTFAFKKCRRSEAGWEETCAMKTRRMWRFRRVTDADRRAAASLATGGGKKPIWLLHITKRRYYIRLLSELLCLSQWKTTRFAVLTGVCGLKLKPVEYSEHFFFFSSRFLNRQRCPSYLWRKIKRPAVRQPTDGQKGALCAVYPG